MEKLGVGCKFLHNRSTSFHHNIGIFLYLAYLKRSPHPIVIMPPLTQYLTLSKKKVSMRYWAHPGWMSWNSSHFFIATLAADSQKRSKFPILTIFFLKKEKKSNSSCLSLKNLQISADVTLAYIFFQFSCF